MTIYSQHPHRGKVQILATYNGEEGLRSSTVTSVESPELAEPIVDALNRISACLTLPLCAWDTHHSKFSKYPDEHLSATREQRRDKLLVGTHSLWYEYVKLHLHKALEDLDSASSHVSDAVRTAVEAELTTEVTQLQAAWAEYSGASSADVATQRFWDSDLPVILFDGGVNELRAVTREQMDQAEEREFHGAVDEAISDLRLLFAAHARCSEPSAELDESGLSIFVEPFDQFDDHGYFLSIDAPATFPAGRRGWQITISKWVPDSDYSDEEGGHLSGEPVVICSLSAPPHTSAIVDLLDRVGSADEQLIEWARTPMGEALDGTPFIVTDRRVLPS